MILVDENLNIVLQRFDSLHVKATDSSVTVN